MNARPSPFRLTIVHPCVGRHRGMSRYIRSWLMEPLPAAMIAALVPSDVQVRFHDDRLDPIPFDEPADLVAMSVETYTARRAYQIASEYRRRNIPVVMGGFHATLCPEEVAEYAESVVVGEAEDIFPFLIDDYRARCPRKFYRADKRPDLKTTPNRLIYEGKSYLPVRLVEFARGCNFRCEFCAVQSFFGSTHNHRPVAEVVDEVRHLQCSGRLLFFIDDNLTSNPEEARELFQALIPLNVRWVGQTSSLVAHDESMLSLMRRGGCQGVLIGFESLDESSLLQMNKGFNLSRGGPAHALAALRRHGLAVYGTFVFGYDEDTAQTIARCVAFAREHGLFMAAFNHITPFPGTPLYNRLAAQGRMRFDPWWLDPSYRYNMVPFHPRAMSAEELEKRCLEARKEFYGWPSIMQRGLRAVDWRSPFAFRSYLIANALHHQDVGLRDGLPLGDEAWLGTLLKAE